MRRSVVLHLTNDESIVGEIDQLPDPGDQFMIVHDPRLPDGTVPTFLRPDVSTVFLPWHRIAAVELLPEIGFEEVVGFVRE